MTRPRPPKKSETLEIRLPHPTKVAFMARCRADGRSASAELRGFIEQQLSAPGPPRAGFRLRPVAVGSLIAAAVAAAAAPALARAGATSGFERLDANQDRHITEAEFRHLDRDRNGAVSLEEYRR